MYHNHPSLKLYQKFFLSCCLLVSVFNFIIPAASAAGIASIRIQSNSILIIQSYAPDFVWTTDMQYAIVNKLLQGNRNIDYHVEYLDTKNNPSQQYLNDVRKLFQEKYRGHHFDAVIVCDNPALNFYASVQAIMFPNTPVIAAGIQKDSAIPSNLQNLHIIFENPAIHDSISIALSQNSNAKNIYIIDDKTITGEAIDSEIKSMEKRFHSLHFIYLSTKDFSTITETLHKANRNDIAFLGTYFDKTSLQEFNYMELIDIISKQSNIPIYTAWNFNLRSTIVGGAVTDGKMHGTKAATVTMDLLSGKPMQTHYQTDAYNSYIFNYYGLKRFSITQSTMPVNFQIINNPKSFYQEHKSFIIMFLIIITVLLLFIVILIRNSRNLKKLHQKEIELNVLNQHIIETQKEIVLTLGEVIETRSKETASHVRRVAKMSLLLANVCGLSEQEATCLEAASPMHDVGKIGIPDSILNKPGKLTPEEFNIMKQHTEYGYKIMKSSGKDILKAAAIIARQHHEKWDGKGYMLGLSGEDIHPFARITAICDVYDALRSKRTYKSAWEADKAIQYVTDESGKSFDPKMAAIFLSNIDQIETIRANYPDQSD